MKLQTKAFTLVELIVVITILAVLSTIGFVSYSGYLAGSRDTNRISQLKAISDGLHLFSTSHSLPSPDDSIDVKANGEVISQQGYAGKNVLETITYSTLGVDPKDNVYYSYYLTRDKKYFQLMGFLEDEDNLQVAGIFNKTKAIDYSVRYPTVHGAQLGILTGTGSDLNIPIQEISSIKSAGNLDVSTSINEFVAKLSDIENIIGTGSKLISGSVSGMVGKGNKSCKDILRNNSISNNADGKYWITVDGNVISVYCDMTTDGGGRTLVWHGYPTEARYLSTIGEKVNISNDILFNSILVRGVNLNYYEKTDVIETAKLTETIPYYYNKVGVADNALSPKVSFHGIDGNEDVKLTSNIFFYGYGNGRRVFWKPLYINANYRDIYIGGSHLKNIFDGESVGCITTPDNNYCNDMKFDESPLDSVLGISMKQYQETQVYIK